MRVSIQSLARFALAAATSGSSQNFLGAGWVGASLGRAPNGWRRALALRYLALSPHYFYRTAANASLTTPEFLESEIVRNRDSRQLIIDALVSNYLKPGFTCLDYGCGPGFLAYAASPQTAKVIACDISSGVLACARIVNPGPNIDYRQIASNGSIPVADETVDLVYSFAVVQHVTDDIFQGILREVRRVLKPEGVAIFHLVLDGQKGWKPESAWRADRSLKGRLKWRFGLWCFSRPKQTVERLVSDAGFRSMQITSIADMGADLHGDDIEQQHLCVFMR